MATRQDTNGNWETSSVREACCMDDVTVHPADKNRIDEARQILERRKGLTPVWWTP